MNIFLVILRRDLLLAFRHRAELIQPLLFFVLVIVLFQLAMGQTLKASAPQLAAQVAPAIIWIAALLSALLNLDPIFRSDMEDGTLEQMIISTQPTSLLVLAKIVAHWIITGLMLCLSGPLLGLVLGLNGEATKILFYTLLLGTPVLSAIGAIGVALTVALRRGGVILSLLVLPLFVPLLIFATQTVLNHINGYPVDASLTLLGGLLVLSLSLSPLACAAALRVSVS